MAEIKQNDDNTKQEIEEKSWAEDIENNDYYYDDSHGYEVYIDDDLENEQIFEDLKKNARNKLRLFRASVQLTKFL